MKISLAPDHSLNIASFADIEIEEAFEFRLEWHPLLEIDVKGPRTAEL